MFEPNRALAPFNEPEVTLNVSQWPETWGWYVLLATGLVWGLLKIRSQLKRWWRNRYRREALRRLRSIVNLPIDRRMSAAHELLKIVSVYVYGREMISNLVETDWYALLNDSLDKPVFTQELQSLLHSVLYRDQEPSRAAVQSHVRAIEYWLKMHSSELGDD
jgi:hypothetical protein